MKPILLSASFILVGLYLAILSPKLSEWSIDWHYKMFGFRYHG